MHELHYSKNQIMKEDTYKKVNDRLKQTPLSVL